MTQPRKHHYLPQFYLRGFSDNGKQIYRIEKPEGCGHLCSIKDSAAIRDFYVLDHQQAEDSQAFEKQLADIEGSLSVAIDQVVEFGIINNELHSRLIDFVSLMRFRVPAYKLIIEKELEWMVKSSGRILERNGKLPILPKDIGNLFEQNKVSVSISNWKCLEMMCHDAADPQFLGMLEAMTPSILRVPQDRILLTSDQPVAVYNPDADPSTLDGLGIIHPKSQISIPLSRSVLLLLTWDKSASRERLMNLSEIDEFNRRTVIMADSYIFATKKSEWALRTVDQYAHHRAGLDFSEIDTGDRIFNFSIDRPVMPENKYNKVG